MINYSSAKRWWTHCKRSGEEESARYRLAMESMFILLDLMRKGDDKHTIFTYVTIWSATANEQRVSDQEKHLHTAT
jgi:hypothetical protein